MGIISFELKRYLQQYYDIPNDYATGNKVGIMCAEATLPTSSFATSEVKVVLDSLKSEITTLLKEEGYPLPGGLIALNASGEMNSIIMEAFPLNDNILIDNIPSDYLQRSLNLFFFHR